ncbi:hypothetical protein MMC07_005736 [Pseudocyphellaria aurata]|nr:hypothetical protein [Pseudocyphellaria aurata]
MSSTPAPLESESSTHRPLKCQLWMNQLRKDLNANFEAHDRHCTTNFTKILGKHTGRIQQKLQRKLSRRKVCTLARLVENRPRLHRRTIAYMKKAKKAKNKVLTTIHEDQTPSSEEPKMPQPLEKTEPESWIREPVQVHTKNIVSDLVDASTKPRTKKPDNISVRTARLEKLSQWSLRKGEIDRIALIPTREHRANASLAAAPNPV